VCPTGPTVDDLLHDYQLQAAIEKVARDAKHAIAARLAALATREDQCRTTRILGEKLRAKIEYQPDGWDQSPLRECWFSYPQYAEQFLSIASFRVKLVEFKKLAGRSAQRAMLARFSQTDQPWIAGLTAKTCLLRPDGVSDLGPVLQLAERAVTGTEQVFNYRWFLVTKGMADYRGREFGKAIDRLKESLSLVQDTRYRRGWQNRDPALAGTAYVFMAMAHHQQGHPIEARRALDQATQLINQMDRKTSHTITRSAWANWLIFRLVYREAEQLVRSQAEARK
jgi:hypothetical protein